MNAVERLRLLVAAFALLGFVLSVIVHVVSMGGSDVQRTFPQLMILDIASVALFVVFFNVQKRDRRATTARRECPSVLVLSGLALLAYMVFSFVSMFFDPLGLGTPRWRDGHYVLVEKGRILRGLTPGEYESAWALRNKLFSSVSMFLCFAPMAYFGFRRAIGPLSEAPAGQAVP